MKKLLGKLTGMFTNALMQAQPLPTLYDQLPPDQKAKADEIIAGIDLTDPNTIAGLGVDAQNQIPQSSRGILKRSWNTKAIDPNKIITEAAQKIQATLDELEEMEKQLAKQRADLDVAAKGFRQSLIDHERMKIEGVVKAVGHGVQQAIIAPERASFRKRTGGPAVTT